MRKTTWILLLVVVCPGCPRSPESDWWQREYPNSDALAKMIYDEVNRIGDKGIAGFPVATLSDDSELFVDEDGLVITVRHVAVTILEEANTITLPSRPDRGFLLVCRHDIDDRNWHKFHIPALTEAEFRDIEAKLQQQNSPDEE